MTGRNGWNASETNAARRSDIVAHHLTVMTTLAEAAVAASASSPEKATDVMRSVAVTGLPGPGGHPSAPRRPARA